MAVIKENDRIKRVSDLLYRASKSIRILTNVSWSIDIREQFFSNGARELPVVSYSKINTSKPIEIINEARRFIKNSNIDSWLGRQADTLEKSALMLAGRGTPYFYHYSSQLYGNPMDVLRDNISTPFALASHFDAQIESLANVNLGAPPVACYLADTVADEIKKAVKSMFGEDAPEVYIVDELSANALAGAKRIRIRRTACFTDKDISQLINHEAYVHVATAINGKNQSDLKILRASHPGTTKTQEGLAVFAEFITGSIDFDRMRRLADRVLAIQMSIDGADFIEVYQYFLERTGNKEQSYENARRVFRGGVMTGGAPFTKDIVYLDGLLRVNNFLRAIVSSGRIDCLRLLFCGKLDIEDIPVLHELSDRGLCHAPKYLPPWAKDMRFLLCALTYSSFLNGMDLSHIRSHYDEILAAIPRN